MDVEKILDTYRNGDEDMRLRLFLAFRDLRDHFSRIEQENPVTDFFAVSVGNGKQRLGQAA